MQAPAGPNLEGHAEAAWQMPSFFFQYVALTRKNFNIKRRNRKQTCYELIFPVIWSVIVAKLLVKQAKSPVDVPATLCGECQNGQCVTSNDGAPIGCRLTDGWRASDVDPACCDNLFSPPPPPSSPTSPSPPPSHCYYVPPQSQLWFAPDTTEASEVVQAALGVAGWRACAVGHASRAALEEAYLSLAPSNYSDQGTAVCRFTAQPGRHSSAESAAHTFGPRVGTGSRVRCSVPGGGASVGGGVELHDRPAAEGRGRRVARTARLSPTTTIHCRPLGV